MLTRLGQGPDTYLYVGRVDPEVAVKCPGEQGVGGLSQLAHEVARKPAKFNAALLLGSLIIVGLSILTALKLADRLVRPVGELVDAAGRIEKGDFSARVPGQPTRRTRFRRSPRPSTR